MPLASTFRHQPAVYDRDMVGKAELESATSGLQPQRSFSELLPHIFIERRGLR